ncbi:MAG: DUF5305 family protein [archaeon]|nr:DUF5305 family protein [archaeon]
MNLSTYKFAGAVARRYKLILVIFIVALCLSSLYTYAVFGIPHYETRAESESVTLYQYKAWYEHSVEVEQGNPLWPVGWTLSNQPVYFSTLSPNLNGSFNFQINAPSSSDISANYLTKLVLSSSSKNTTYWRKENTLSSGRMDLRGSDKLQNYISLNISEIMKEIKTIQDSLDFSGGITNVEVITTVRYNGEVGGERVDEQKDFSLPIKISGSIYEVPRKSYEETIKKDVVREVNVLLSPSNLEKIVASSSISIFFLLILAFTLVKLKYKPLDDSAIQELIKEEEYGKFKDLISKGKLPSDINISMVRLEIKSLEDLYLFSSVENPKSKYIPILPNKSQTPILLILHPFLLILSLWDLEIGIYLGFGSICRWDLFSSYTNTNRRYHRYTLIPPTSPKHPYMRALRLALRLSRLRE